MLGTLKYFFSSDEVLQLKTLTNKQMNYWFRPNIKFACTIEKWWKDVLRSTYDDNKKAYISLSNIDGIYTYSS